MLLQKIITSVSRNMRQENALFIKIFDVQTIVSHRICFICNAMWISLCYCDKIKEEVIKLCDSIFTKTDLSLSGS